METNCVVSTQIDTEYQHIGKTQRCQNHDHDVKAQELKNIEQLKKLLAEHVQNNCF